jgi:hypothetical protein
MSSSADDLNVLTEKLKNTINEIQDRYESFIDSNQLYKQGKINEKDFFASIGDYLVASSAMNFITAQAIFKMRSVLQKTSANNQSGQLSPDSSSVSSQGSTAIGKSSEQNQTPSSEQFTMSKPQGQVIENIEAPRRQTFMEAGQNSRSTKDCISCGKPIPRQSKFCSRCGKSQ